MSDQMPMFEDPAPPVEPKPPKKPRQKPVRKARKLAAPKPVPKKRRKRKSMLVPVPKNQFGRLPEMLAACKHVLDVLNTFSLLEQRAILVSVAKAK